MDIPIIEECYLPRVFLSSISGDSESTPLLAKSDTPLVPETARHGNVRSSQGRDFFAFAA